MSHEPPMNTLRDNSCTTVTGRFWLDGLLFLGLCAILLLGARRLVVYHVVPANLSERVPSGDGGLGPAPGVSVPGDPEQAP